MQQIAHVNLVYIVNRLEQGAYSNEALQEVEGLVNGGVCIEAGSGVELIMHDGLQALCQAVSLLT